MAYTNEERARERLQRARSFLEKAHALMLQDDLVYRSALDDAVSAIKNNLQGYLLQRIVLMAGSAPIPWQEAVAGNRMPDLLRACSEAGLDLRGLDREIRKLNDERNSRAHEDPLRRVDTAQARQAVDLALMLHRRVQDALKATGARIPVPSVNLATRLPAPELAKVGIGRAAMMPARAGNGPSPTLAAGASGAVATVSAPARTAATPPSPVRADEPPAAAKRAPEPDDDEGDDDEGDERAAVASAVRRRWVQRFIVRGGSMAAVLLVGTAAGVLLTLFAGGALDLRGAGRASSSTTATATALPANTLFSAGALLVGMPACQTGHATIQLRNTGATPVPFSAGSPDNPSATFTTGQGIPPAQTLFGSVAPSATTTLTAAASPGGPATYHVVVTAQGGSVELIADAC